MTCPAMFRGDVLAGFVACALPCRAKQEMEQVEAALKRQEVRMSGRNDTQRASFSVREYIVAS